MHESVGEFIASYLQGEAEAVAEVDRWIVAAARPFQRKLMHDWDDVLQDSRLEVFRALDRGEFRGDAQLRTYVWRVVSHSCLDRVRRGARWQWTELETGEEEAAAGEGWTPAAGPALETAELVARVLAEVPEECRHLWRMVLAGLSYREMSRELGASEGALRVRVLRCRKRALEVRDRLLSAGA